MGTFLPILEKKKKHYQLTVRDVYGSFEIYYVNFQSQNKPKNNKRRLRDDCGLGSGGRGCCGFGEI